MADEGSEEHRKAPTDRDWPNEAKLDEAYRSDPFPSFADWNESMPGDEARRADELRVAIDAEAEAKGSEAVDRALKVALRAAAVDTGALEGLYATDEGITMTIARRAAGWEALAQSREILPFFEAQLAALEIVMDLVTEAKPLATGGVTEVAVKELHREITSVQATYEVQTPAGAQRHALRRGEYKTMPNHVLGADGSYFSYAPVADTPTEMRRFVDELSSEGFSKAHPLVQCAYAHYGLVRIHPFADGNGRLARALSSLYLLRRYGVPLVVFSEDRAKYLEQLRGADRGRHEVFTEFVGWAVVGSLELVFDEIERGVPESVEDRARQINRLLSKGPQAGRLRAEKAAGILVDLAERSLRGVVSEAQQRIDSALFEVSTRIVGGSGSGGFSPTTSAAPNTIFLRVLVEGDDVLDERVAFYVDVQVPSSAGLGEEPKVRLSGKEHLTLDASRLVPDADPRVIRRVRNWAEREVSRFLDMVEEQLRLRSPAESPS